MLRMSKMTDYGTVVMTYLAREPSRVHAASEIADQVNMPVPTVSKILKMLARSGLVSAQRGTKGGYMLMRSASEISMAEVIDALEGRFGLTECTTTPGQCEQETSCSVRANWERINGVVRNALEGVMLAEMVTPPGVQRVTFSQPTASSRP